MNDIEKRIEQWEKMAEQAPDDMAYFSLGQAYKDGERHEQAAEALAKAIEMNPTMSRAYQLRAQVLIALDKEDEAGEVLTKGFPISAERGDVMPQRAMQSLLEKLGLPVPEIKSTKPDQSAIEGDENVVMDKRSGQPQPRLAGPPMRGPVGQYIFDHFGQVTWNAWIGQGTKVINELRLDFANEKHGDTYEEHMLEWLGITREEVDEYASQSSD